MTGNPEKLEVSLKGGAPKWTGMSDQSTFSPTGGSFATLKNCYVSQDGTEIRRMPPLTVWADPILAEVPYGIDVMAFGVGTEVTLGSEHYIEDTGTTFTRRVYILNNASIPNGWYTCYRMDDLKIKVNVTTVGNSTAGSVYVERGITPVGMRMVGNRLCVVAETLTTEVFSGVNSSKNSIATWVQQGALNYASTVNQFEYWASPLNQRYVNSGTAVYSAGPATFTMSSGSSHGMAAVGTKFKVTLAAPFDFPGTYDAVVSNPYTGFTSASYTALVPTSQVGVASFPNVTFDRPPRRKAQLDIADGRLLIAVPGHGVMLQAHLPGADYGSYSSIITKKTRALGVPKGVRWSASPVSGTGKLASSATYYYSVGYKDRVTGEYGLISDPEPVTLGAGDNYIAFQVFTPRAALREVNGCSIIIYLSEPNASQGTMRPVVDVFVNQETINHNVLINVLELTPLSARVPEIENMPMGGSIVRTVKGTTFFGGLISSVYDNTVLGSERISVYHRNAASDPGFGVKLLNNEIVISPLGTGYATSVTGSMAADYQLPSSMGGLLIAYENYPVMPLKKRLNARTLTSLTGAPGATQVWELDGVHENIFTGTASIDALLVMPKGMYWWSERGYPGISPATNRAPLDRIRGYDLTGFGRMNDTLIMCTDKETYALQWDRSPLGADPRMVSSEFGCIAASSMISYDDGCAWLSERGPVAMIGGAFSWIGQPIYERWKTTYKRDTRGQMPHAFAAHDPTRKLLLFFVRHDLNSTTYVNTANDDLKSKVPCDEVLVYNYAAGAWSYWELTSTQECVDAEMILCNDGNWRLGILTFDKRILAFDETLNVTTSDPLTVEIVSHRHVMSNVERNSKIGAVMLRNETDPLGPGFICQASTYDDANAETLLTNNNEVNWVNGTRSRYCAGASRAHEAKLRLLFVGIGPLRIKDIVVEASPGG